MKKDKYAIGIIVMMLAFSVAWSSLYYQKYQMAQSNLDLISEMINLVGPTDKQVFCMGFRYDKGNFTSIEIPYNIFVGNKSSEIVVKITDLTK